MRSRSRLRYAALAAAMAAVAIAVGGAGAEPPAPSLGPSILAGPAGRSSLVRWTLREDFADRGIALGWRRGGFSGTSVEVPDVLHPDAYTGAAGERNYEGSVAWYRTSVQAQVAGTYAFDFQSANFLAQVWVDGHSLGRHRGSYLPFELRAPLTAGSHVLVVRIDWRNPGVQSLEGFHRTWFNWGGLNGEVEVRRIGESELEQPALQTKIVEAPAGDPAPAPGIAADLGVSVTVVNHGPARTLAPTGTLTREGRSYRLTFPPVRLEHEGSTRVTGRAVIPSPALWSPSQPSLYELQLQIGEESSYSGQVGLREIAWRGGHIYLNGHRLLLHGATIPQDAAHHGDALTPADDGRIVAELKAIGANAARSQHPLDPLLLERLDAAGILVWQGIGPVEGAGNWLSSTPALNAAAEQQARTAVLAEQLHPSVIAWNLVDEVAGNGRNSFEVSYVRSLSRWLHTYDPTRLVGVDVWGDHPPQNAGALYRDVDAVAETDYSGWYDQPHSSSGQLAAQMRARLSAMERTFAGKVLLISEFGAESNTLNPSAAPGGYGYQANLLAEHISVYRADPHVSGMLVWLLRDYPLTPRFQGGSIHAVLPAVRLIEGLNQKGLFTRAGKAKPAAGVVARLFGALPLG